MRIIKNIFRDIYLYLLWGVISWLGIGFLFAQVTDADVSKKITFYIDSSVSDVELAVKLEEQLPAGIKMIKVHPFTYAMMDDSSMDESDFFIVAESKLSDYGDKFADLSAYAENHPEFEYYIYEEKPIGILVSKAGESSGIAGEYITYTKENWYLFINAKSVHTALLNNSADNAAFEVLEGFMKIK